MNDPSRWSLDRDPPRDEPLGRLLRAADGRGPGADVNWERLHAALMRGLAPASGPAPDRGREWWDVVVEWRRVAAAASIAAMLAAGVLLSRSGAASSGELTLTKDDPPESVALARVVAAYPDDAVLSSLLETARTDELTAWDPR